MLSMSSVWVAFPHWLLVVMAGVVVVAGLVCGETADSDWFQDQDRVCDEGHSMLESE